MTAFRILASEVAPEYFLGYLIVELNRLFAMCRFLFRHSKTIKFIRLQIHSSGKLKTGLFILILKNAIDFEK